MSGFWLTLSPWNTVYKFCLQNKVTYLSIQWDKESLRTWTDVCRLPSITNFYLPKEIFPVYWHRCFPLSHPFPLDYLYLFCMGYFPRNFLSFLPHKVNIKVFWWKIKISVKMFLYNTSIINKHRYCKLKREFIKNQIMKEKLRK